MPSMEFDRLKQDMRSRPDLAEQVSRTLASAGSPGDVARALSALGYDVSASDVAGWDGGPRELDEDNLDKVAGAGPRASHFS